MVAVLDLLLHVRERRAELGEHRDHLGVVGEILEARWLVGEDSSYERRLFACEPERDARARRDPRHVDGTEIEVLDQRDEVGDVVVDGAGLGRVELALAVPAQVVGHDAERLGEPGHHRVPGRVVDPRTVHEHEWLAVSGLLVAQRRSVELLDRHRDLLVRRVRYAGRRTHCISAATSAGWSVWSMWVASAMTALSVCGTTLLEAAQEHVVSASCRDDIEHGRR